MTVILGAGMTGLAAGRASGLPVLEAAGQPGGICSSYYVRPGASESTSEAPTDGEAYRFEVGGGHWIFGGDRAVLRLIRHLAPVKTYVRRSSVYFREQDVYVPYPLQNHLSHLDRGLALGALAEMAAAPGRTPRTMADWLEQSFGKTLTELFFGPFHELYTAGLWRYIAPQDSYKSPVAFALALKGAWERTPAVGYNATFVYPEGGLNKLAQQLAQRCQVEYGKRAVQVDVRGKAVIFADGSELAYDSLLSTLPLNRMIEMTGLQVDSRPGPYTSVLVLNLGARRGARCPEEHWLYNPDSRSGFHRVGFYSNVDVSFLPVASHFTGDRVSLYVERAFAAQARPSETEIHTYTQAVLQELREWDFIEEAEVVDPTWIDVAYTWSWPESNWRQQAIRLLEERDIYQVGRYGRWTFQGIADSIRDGLAAGGAFR